MLAGLGHPIGCRRMRVEETMPLRSLAHQFDFTLERREERRQSCRVPAGLCGHVLADTIRLRLLAPTVGREDDALGKVADAADQIADQWTDDTCQTGCNPEDDGKRSLPRNPLHSMSCGD